MYSYMKSSVKLSRIASGLPSQTSAATMNSSLRSTFHLQPRLNLTGRLLRNCLTRSRLHTNAVDQVPTKALTTTKDSSSPPTSQSTQCKPSNAPLSLLPLSFLLRSYLIASLSSSPHLLTPSLRLLSIIAIPPSPFLDPDRNPLLRYVLRKTLYAHFCAGENLDEVRKTSFVLKGLGYSGVILNHGREIISEDDEMLKVGRVDLDLAAQEDVENWKRSNLETVRLVEEGGFVALKLSGAGRQAIQQLTRRAPPSEQIETALTEICDLAKGKGVAILVDAEHHSLQAGIDNWSLSLQKAFNSKGSKAIIYGTYQAYLRSTPRTLSEHLSLADREGFILGVKLVRGAYLSSDPRHLFWDSKLETDKVYDDITSALLRGEYNDSLKRPGPNKQVQLPPVNLMLATHNHASVLKALKIQENLLILGHDHRIELSYGQLMGMADEVGCELIMAGRTSPPSSSSLSSSPSSSSSSSSSSPSASSFSPSSSSPSATSAPSAPSFSSPPSSSSPSDPSDPSDPSAPSAPSSSFPSPFGPQTAGGMKAKVYKYLPWGSVAECMKYLVRRGEENRDALERTVEGRRALGGEIWRRIRG